VIQGPGRFGFTIKGGDIIMKISVLSPGEGVHAR